MNSHLLNLNDDNGSPYEVDSRREIIAILKSIKDGKQFIKMIIAENDEVSISAILNVNETTNTVVLDLPSTASACNNLLKAPRIYFEAELNKISIKFSTTKISPAQYKGTPALACTIPATLIRLQRRDFYRINTPVVNPIMCLMSIPTEEGEKKVKLPLADISCGGVALIDENKIINMEFGSLYDHCQIDLPGIGLVSVTLEVRNYQEITLRNHKVRRRVGFQFKNLSKTMMSQIQKLITKIEREHNAMQTGLG